MIYRLMTDAASLALCLALAGLVGWYIYGVVTVVNAMLGQ